MPSTNHFKFGASGISSATRSGFKVGVKGGADYGPTSTNGFYNGITPPVGGYTIYVDKASQGPSIHVANDDTQCIFFLKSFGATGSTIGNVLAWADGQSNILVITSELVIGDLPGGGGGGGGVGSWYFYSDEGTINANPPIANGNAIFTVQGSPVVETFNPNKASGVTYLNFSVNDSTGTNYTSQFSGYTGGTGTITISQNGDTATYTSTTPGSFAINNAGGLFFVIATGACTQTKSSNAAYVYGDPISITFS